MRMTPHRGVIFISVQFSPSLEMESYLVAGRQFITYRAPRTLETLLMLRPSLEYWIILGTTDIHSQRSKLPYAKENGHTNLYSIDAVLDMKNELYCTC